MGWTHLRLPHVFLVVATLMTEVFFFATLLTAFLVFAALETELVFAEKVDLHVFQRVWAI